VHRYHVSIPARPRVKYPVIVDPQALEELPSFLETLHDVDRFVILYDAGLTEIADKVAERIDGAVRIAVPSGESSKSVAQVERIVQDLLLAHVSRKSVIINVGGGMVTDLGGFVASVFMRGIRYINIPTSLMGMVDAAIGGKVYINAGPVKNMIGNVWHPQAVLVDVDILAGMPDRLLRDGLTEVIKMAVMLDSEFFGWFKEHIDLLLEGDRDVLTKTVEHAARLKVEVVSSSEEGGGRMLLNFGHTIGHALEALTNFKLSHGEAVSIGMVCEMQLIDFADQKRVRDMLETLGMPVDLPMDTDVRAMWDIMKNDKKGVAGDVRIAVPTKIGDGVVQTLTRDVFLKRFS